MAGLTKVRTVRIAVFALIGCMLLWVHLYEFSQTLYFDSYVYLIIGKYVARGLMPYRDLWEMKPPGIFWYLGGVFSVLPAAIWSVRVADFLLYLCGAFAFYKLCRFEANRALAVVGTGLWAYFAHHPQLNLGGVYTEEYSGICEILAMVAATAYSRSGRCGLVLLSGLAVAAAILFKHPGAAAIFPALILVADRRRMRTVPLFLAGALLPLLLTIAYFWYWGALSEFLSCNLWFIAPYANVTHPGGGWLWTRLTVAAQQIGSYLRQWPVVAGAILVGVPVCLMRPTRLRLAAITWLALDLAGIVAQGHYYQHHFIQMIPSAFLVGTLGVAWCVQWRHEDRWYMWLLRPAFVVATLVYGYPHLMPVLAERQARVRSEWRKLLAGPSNWRQDLAGRFEAEIGEYVRKRTKPSDRLYLHAWGATVLGIYWVADRAPASRYFFSFAPLSAAQKVEQLAELEQTKPEYVGVFFPQSSYFYLMPYLLQQYSVETVKYGGYRAEMWVRNRVRGLSSGSSTDLHARQESKGIAIESANVASLSSSTLIRLRKPKRGQWTSPVVPVRSDDGKVAIDWNPRADFAVNRTGLGSVRASAAHSPECCPAEAVLGMPSDHGYWMTYPRSAPLALTVDLGSPVVTDVVVLIPSIPFVREDVERLRLSLDAQNQSQQEFNPLSGEWRPGENGALEYHFAPQAISSLRLLVTPETADRGLGLRRIHIPSLGMGINVQYRTGPEPNLDNAPWMPVPDEEGPVWIQAERYVQVQTELWSEYEGIGPVLRYVQVGRELFRDDEDLEGGSQ